MASGGASYDEAADALEIPEGQYRTLRARAKHLKVVAKDTLRVVKLHRQRRKRAREVEASAR